MLSSQLGCLSTRTVIFALIAMFAIPAKADPATTRAVPEAPIDFDIPAQPLANALEAYSVVTGQEILYDSNTVLQLRSTAIRGPFTPADGLNALLNGTSLSARSIAESAITVFPVDEAATDRAAVGPPPDKSSHSHYFSVIQAGVERAFCHANSVGLGRYRAILKFSLNEDGHIRQTKLVGTTGSGDRDRMIERTLDGIALGRRPPADLPQPIMMVVLPQAPGHTLTCGSAQ